MSEISKEDLQAYLDEIEKVNKKHKMRLVPVLTSTAHSLNAQFNVEGLEKESKTDESADQGDKGA